MSAKEMVLVCLFTALIVVGAYLSFPLGPVPFTLQIFFVFLCGLLLKPQLAALSLALYLLMGAAGLPVFAGGKGGVAELFGPTGGFKVGFLPGVVLVSLCAAAVRRQQKWFIKSMVYFIGLVAGAAVIYAAGIGWLVLQIPSAEFQKFLSLLLWYLLFDLGKAALSLVLAQLARPRLEGHSYVNSKPAG